MRKLAVALVGVFGLVLAPEAAAQPTRIYIANDDHTDFMWSADAETYAKVFVEMLDFHLELADETAGNPPPYRSRFNADGSYWLWSYQQQKTPAEFARLIERVRDGTISAPLNTLVCCYGGQPAEAVLRGMYYAGRLERQHGLRFRQAVAMENQTLPLGLASLWAGAGAEYSWKGVCGCANRVKSEQLGNRDHEIYWYTGRDEQRVLMKWHSLAPGGNRSSGGYAEAFDPVAAVRFLDSDADFLRRYCAPGASESYRVRAAFGFGWDALDRKTGQTYAADPKRYPLVDHFHLVAQRETTADRQVIVSNQEDFFRDFDATHGAELPAQRVTFGNEWDLYSASMSETSARVKRAVEKLRAAELLVALVSLESPDFMDRHVAARDRAFHDLGLYWEHNWTADGPIARAQRAAWQEQLATGIEIYVQSIHDEALVRLGGMIPRPDGTDRFFVLNPLGWQRTGAVDFAYQGSSDVHVHDPATARDVPHQIVMLGGRNHLRILAADVPSAGYKVFEIRPGRGTAPTDDAAMVSGADGSLFENDAVQLVVERDGAIRSLIDKRRGHAELAAVIDGLKVNDFAADSDDGQPLRIENRGPVSVTVRARTAAGLDRTTAITLYRNSDRVEIDNELTENFSDVRHWAFGFTLDDPIVRTEEVGAVIVHKLQSAGGDYANSAARYDYVTVNHFADLTAGSGERGVTISSPDLVFAKLGRSTVETLDTSTPQIRMLAGGQVDGSRLGIPAQDGQRYFRQRFALRPHAGYDQTAAMKFALEHQNPLVAGCVTGATGGTAGDPYPATTHSLLAVSHPDVLLWALKVHEDGLQHGLVARVWNQSDQPAPTKFSVSGRLTGAQRTTHIETWIEPMVLVDGKLETTLGAQRMETFALQFRR